MSADFYDLLEVSEDASQDDIRDAFREKVRVYHPDHNDDPRASAQFTAVKKAYDTLGDPVERNAYDRMGHIDYVNKRLDGLPDPEKWAPSGLEDDGAGSSSVTSSGTSSGASSRTSSSASSTGYSSGGRSTGSSAGSTTGTSTGSSTGSTTSTRNSTSTGRSASTGGSTSRHGSTSTGGTTSSGSSSSTGGSRSSSGSTAGSSDSGSTRRTASDGAGTANAGSAADYEVDPVVAWISRHGVARAIVGWKLLWVVFAIYAAGLGVFARLEQTSVLGLVDRLTAAGTDADALLAALERDGMAVVAEATIRPLLSGGDPGTLALASTALLVSGAVLLPTAVGLLVYVTRTSPGWKPNYLYVVATLGPLLGLAAGLASTPPLSAELALFVGLPVAAVFVMVVSAFVRPRVLIFFQNLRS